MYDAELSIKHTCLLFFSNSWWLPMSHFNEKNDLATWRHVHVLISAVEYYWRTGMVEVLAPRWSQQYNYWQLWMLALQPGTVH